MLKTFKFFTTLREQLSAKTGLSFSTMRYKKQHGLMRVKSRLSGVNTFYTGEPHMALDSTEDYFEYEMKENSEKKTFVADRFSKSECFPDSNLPDKLFNGVVFRELPIVNIKATPNNTIISLSDFKGVVKLLTSCGVEGFKNTKKGTNVAAQAAAYTFSQRALRYGYKTVRIRVQGLGPGRASSIRGLSLGGMDMVSITDNTHVSENPPRPKKPRRI